ncbi:MAG TPA: hypothetical protein VIV14_01090 [Gammaproteobacteria bacterium]
MPSISTPFLMLAFATLVVFAIACAGCFLLGRGLGKRDRLGEPEPRQASRFRDRLDPIRGGPWEQSTDGFVTRSAVSEPPPVIKPPIAG